MIYSEDAEDVKVGDYLLVTEKVVDKIVLPNGNIRLITTDDNEYHHYIEIGPKRTLEMSSHEFTFNS